jgi:hypothetical protein
MQTTGNSTEPVDTQLNTTVQVSHEVSHHFVKTLLAGVKQVRRTHRTFQTANVVEPCRHEHNSLTCSYTWVCGTGAIARKGPVMDVQA